MALLVIFSLAVAQAPKAHAYGPLAQWQIGLSFNCDNVAYCGSQLSGFWGWAEFDTGIPAMAGHFSAMTLFGLQAPPGTNFEIQVVQLSH